MEPQVIAIAASTLITVVAGWFLTKPEDIRSQRWPCIILSIPLVGLVANIYCVPIAGNSGALAPGIAAILAVGALGFVWMRVFAHYASGGFLHLITGNLNAQSNTVDLRLARWHRKEGRTLKSIDFALRELEKDPLDYEVLVLLADLHEENKDIVAAHAALETLFNSGHLAGIQVDIIQERKTRLEEKILIDQLNARK